ncbi:MAG: single-stranded DNA-binding protein [Erysipelotrichaceae bacterium]|nr:single-stranded DNA-binding protein [Erysipelotrichaceae bacterium]
MINSVVLVGRITKDPELRQAGNSQCVNFTLAVNRRFNKNGSQEADFINCVAWAQTATFMSTYVRKGSLLGVEGRIETRSYDNKEGKRVYVTEVRCESVQFLESKSANATRMNTTDNFSGYNNSTNEPRKEESFDDTFSDIPSLDISSDDLPFY